MRNASHKHENENVILEKCPTEYDDAFGSGNAFIGGGGSPGVTLTVACVGKGPLCSVALVSSSTCNTI